jgi:hypothetical protein
MKLGSREYGGSSRGGNAYGGDGHGSGHHESHYGPGGQYGGPDKSSQRITIQVPNDTVGLIIGKGIFTTIAVTIT